MVFSSLTFLVLFLPLTLALYFLRGNIRWRNGVLLAASLLFYGWSEPKWILALLLSALVNYGCALQIAKGKHKRGFLVLGVGASLLLLFYFKYFSFFLSPVFSALGWPAPQVVMPIGVSFYTFQIITYTADVYRGKVKAQTNPLRLLLYVSCFPQLVAGPIVQYGDVAEAIERRETTMDDFTLGMKRFAAGLGKKVLLANLCGAAVEAAPLAGGTAPLSVTGAWYTALMYALQIYFDFSAYSDMAIGLGQVFGFRYQENFNAPYLSASVTEFWRRWHISLGSFFREYVYIPLGGNRRGTGRTIFNLLVVWTLTGLWHGASWNFVLWGLYYGVLLVLERFVFHRAPRFLGWLVTMALVLFGWMLFYYANLSDGFTHILAMLGLSPLASGWGAVPLADGLSMAVIRQYGVFTLIACVCTLPLSRWLRGRALPPWCRSALRGAATVLLTGVLILSMLCLVGQSYNPFIYFRF